MGQRTFKPRHRASPSVREFRPNGPRSSMYDHKWQAYRLRFLRVNPECYSCGKPATEVDHLKPHQGDDILFKKLDNHIPLCESCHSTVTAKFDMRYRAGNPITDKISWLNRNRVFSENWTPKKVKVLGSYEEE